MSILDQLLQQTPSVLDQMVYRLSLGQHKYASTQFNLPVKLAEAVKAFGRSIVPSDLAEDGLEDEPHVTVKCGLHGDDPFPVEQLAYGRGPVYARLGKVSIFPGKQHDVLKVDVDSPDLHSLNKTLADNIQHTDTHPDYKPHVTIAYLKPGTAQKYVGKSFSNLPRMKLSHLIYSKPNGERKTIQMEPRVWVYQCSYCNGDAYNGEPENGSFFRGSAKCQDCGESFSAVTRKPVSKRGPVLKIRLSLNEPEQSEHHLLTVDEVMAASGNHDKELAEYYADLLNLFLHGMTTEPKELLDLAEADLEGTKYKLRRDKIGFWQVVPVSVQFSLSHRTIWLGAQRSPKGGITIQGKFYRGGQFIPGEVLKHATPQEKKKLEQRKAKDEANTEAKRGERLARGVDVEGLSGNLEKFKAELNPRQMGNAKRAFAALKRHHGDQVYHRIEELHNILAASLDANEGREWLQDQLRNRLAGLSAMIGMAKDAGIVAPEKPADTKKRAGKAAKVRSLFSVVRKYGGIDPAQIISDAGREGLVQEGLLGVTVRGGMGLDDMADALEIGGHIKIPDNKNGGDYLRELLKAKAATLQDVAESYESELERSYAEYYRQAEQAGIEARDIEEAVRSGEEAGEVEGSEEEYDEALGDLTAEQLGGDDSFGFGANVEEETKSRPKELSKSDSYKSTEHGKAAYDYVERIDQAAETAIKDPELAYDHELLDARLALGKRLRLMQKMQNQEAVEQVKVELDLVRNEIKQREDAGDFDPWGSRQDLENPVPGGKADNVPDAAFPQDELAQGTQHELEHTGNKAVAKDIAKDHLAEDKGYYDKLEQVEKGEKGEKDFKPIFSASDIPYSVAENAHRWSSFTPDVRAKQEQQEYVSTLNSDWERLAKLAKTPEQQELLKSEFERYKNGFKDKFLAKLHADSRTASSMVTGGSNFPTRRNQKRLDTAHKRLTELLDYRKKAVDAIEKKIDPKMGAIQSNNPEVVDLIQQKIQDAESMQEKMKAANKIIRGKVSASRIGNSNNFNVEFKKGETRESLKQKLIDIGVKENAIDGLLSPDFMGRVGYPDYAIKNNNANIRRMKQRSEDVAKMKSKDSQRQDYSGGVHVTEDPDSARIRIHFPGKPSREVIQKLKQRGFRWSPSEGAWQRHLNSSGQYAVKSVLEELGHKPM